MKRVVLATLAGIISTSAVAQGFNCNLARLPAEITICNNGELSALDRRLNALYYRLRSQLDGEARSELEAEQQAWLHRRNQCGADEGCLFEAYERRLAALSSESEPD